MAKSTTTNNKNGQKGSCKKKGKKQQVKFPVEPRTIQIIKKPRTYMNHSYRDFSSVPPEPNEEFPTEISEMTFPQKVHHILSQPEYSKCIAWQPHGRAFRISIPKMFEAKVCPKYLQHSRYSSFLRELSNYSFKHITQGSDRNCYYHEFMLRGLPHLCKYMPGPKDARRLIPDPENEPDFYAISELYPLPDHEEYLKKEAARPKPEDELPQAGTPRFASDLIGLANDGMPRAKRSRIVAPGGQQPASASTSNTTTESAVTTFSPESAVTAFSPDTSLLANLASNRAYQDILNRGAPSLSSSGLGTNVRLPTTSLSMATPSLAAATAGLPMGDALHVALSRPPSHQMQTVINRNSAVLAALGAAGMPPYHQTAVRPRPRSDATATLAAALLQQSNNSRRFNRGSLPPGRYPPGNF